MINRSFPKSNEYFQFFGLSSADHFKENILANKIENIEIEKTIFDFFFPSFLIPFCFEFMLEKKPSFVGANIIINLYWFY